MRPRKLPKTRKMKLPKHLQHINPHAAGIDVGSRSHFVAVPEGSCEQSVREFTSFTDDLHRMADWLLACGVTTVVMESTGIYWIPVFEVLQQRGLKVFLVDARQMKYVKIYNNTEGEVVVKRLADYFEAPISTFVFNFLDILAPGRSNNVILKEIAGTEAAFRTLMKTWFVHSPLFTMLRTFAKKGFTIIVTSDHGSVLCRRGTMAHGRRETSTNLRYKYGDNLNSTPKESILIKKPEQWRLPAFTLATTYILAKDDFYFVYPNNYNEMVRQFQNSFQHGGISIEELIVPLAILEPK